MLSSENLSAKKQQSNEVLPFGIRRSSNYYYQQTERHRVGYILAKCLRIFLHLLQYQLHGWVGNYLLYLGILHGTTPHSLRIFVFLHQTSAQTSHLYMHSAIHDASLSQLATAMTDDGRQLLTLHKLCH